MTRGAGFLSAAARAGACTLGAYGLTVLVTVDASLLLARAGMDRVEAVVAATLASFAVFAVAAMAAAHARSAARAWAWIAASAALLAPLWILMAPGVP